MNNNKKTTSASQNPRNAIQAFHFLRSLSRINLGTTTFRKRYRAIRTAAYASMARSANPSRVWRRAVFSRLRLRRRRRRSHRKVHRHDALRRLLPGGESMDSCRLLEETIDYVQCLRAQVNIMQEIVDSVKDEGVEEKMHKEGN